MNNSTWEGERNRLVGIALLVIWAGWVTGKWLLCLSLGLAGYLVWLLYQLHKLHNWLYHDKEAINYSNFSGIWERIVYRFQGIEKKSDKRKKRMSKILKRLQSIVRGLPYATVVLKADNSVDWANQMSSDYLNIENSRDRGQRVENLLRIPEFLNLLEHDTSNEIDIVLPHNRERQLALQLIPVQKDLKLLIARDITEQVNLRKTRKNFISNASHELRTPLTVIKGYLDMLIEDDSQSDKSKKSLQITRSQADRMHHIIEDMLVLSRLESSVLDLNECEIVDMPTIINRICSDEIKLLLKNSQSIVVNVDSNLLIKGVESELISVCNNLIQNAIRHTKDDTKIQITWKKNEANEASFCVKDSGMGIQAEHLLHLTERFYRVDEGRSVCDGGTGLGLSIVHHIVQRHGGRLDIDSVFGKGSTFCACFAEDIVVVD